MNLAELKKGTAIEKEHSKSLKKFLKAGVNINQVAKAIAKDHLKEDKNYYKKLSLIEPGLKDEKPVLVIDKTKPPYNDKGKTNFNIRNKPGTYIIYDNKKIVYVGYSNKNVYSALYRHFAHYNDKHKQFRVEFTDLKGITVRVVYTASGAKAKKLEGALILKHRPELNSNKYDGFTTDESEEEILKKYREAFPGDYQNSKDLPF